MQEIKHTIRGSFGDAYILVHVFIADNSDDLLINIHGSYGSIYSSDNKYLNMATYLAENNISSVVLYQSSRIDVNRITRTLKEKQDNFIGKTYSDEVSDLHCVLSFLNSEEVPLTLDLLNVFVNGNSLGGILAFEVTKIIRVRGISTVGTGLRILPIHPLLPVITEVITHIRSYQGITLVSIAGNDQIFDSEDYQRLITSLKSDNTYCHRYEGVNHQFESINAIQSSRIYETVAYNVALLIQGKQLNDQIVIVDP